MKHILESGVWGTGEWEIWLYDDKKDEITYMVRKVRKVK